MLRDRVPNGILIGTDADFAILDSSLIISCITSITKKTKRYVAQKITQPTLQKSGPWFRFPNDDEEYLSVLV